eukprot:gnl/Chilomastix_cuspidata/2844.p1 GENE.gnl/Chilomastix_cuspidata/2844~~gnl/Chilomastix_cuspidata/2844.p1  ORF type:complete len:391 (+),score=169.60 gnl/Chilomastix_cuspidata/2844:1509-2681(+)
MNAARERAHSRVLKEVFAEAKKLLDAEDSLRAEFEHLKERCAGLWRSLETLRTRQLLEDAKLTRLRSAAALCPKLDRRARALVHYCDHSLIPNSSARNFSAFEGAARLNCVCEALRTPLMCIEGIHVSVRPVFAHGVPGGQRRWNIASLSADATICTVDCAREDSSVHLYNFRSGARVRIRVPHVWWACVYGGELFVAELNGRVVRHAPLARAFAGLPLSGFGEFEVPGPIHSAALDRAPDGWVVFESDSNKLVRVDLHARAAHVIVFDQNFASVGSLTGILVPGALCVVREFWGDAATCVMFNDGSARTVAEGLDMYPTLIPSEAAPEDLSRAAVIDRRQNLSFRGRVVSIESAVKPALNQSLVRLYRDVFLCLDDASEKWFALRIVVP